jgi:hypothetical protein
MNFLKYQTQKNLSSDLLPTSILGTISNSTVDIYPWETSIIGANNLNWDPRPIFQSYTDYTPWLDKFNDKFLNSDRSPEYYIWYKRKTRPEITSLRGRMIFNDDPLTSLDILRNYKMILRENDFTLLRKTRERSLGNAQAISSTQVKWSSWIKVPNEYLDKNFLIQAKIRISRNMLGTITRALYKEEPIYIEYRDIKDEVHTYRLSPDNIIEGVWISPLPIDLQERNYFMAAIPIKEFRILNYSPFCYGQNINITWEKIKILNNKLIKFL